MTNAAYAAYANTTPAAIQNKKVSEVFPGYLETSSFTNVVKTFETGIADRWDIHYNLDGLNIYNLMSATRMGNEVVVHFTDYTKLKNLQMELEKKVIELERSNNGLQAFAYAASHDLKEPVRKIQVFSERLKASIGGKLIPKEKTYFERLDVAAQRMNNLIEDLLVYSEINQKNTTKESVELNTLVDQVLIDLDLEIEQKGATINVNNLFAVHGYPRQLHQAFYNLIGNGLKYCKPAKAPVIDILCNKVHGSEMGRLLTIEEQKKDYYQITVKDNGIGFNREDADRIFNLFTRLHGVSEYKGTGIGLSIVRQVIENHQGFIWAESEPGGGATFRILLPVE
jgi:signal transduction histidine kinase